MKRAPTHRLLWFRGAARDLTTKLAHNGVLMMQMILGGKVDVRATDTVLDDKPVDGLEPPPTGRPPASV